MDPLTLWKEGRSQDALAEGWRALARATDPALKVQVAVMLREEPLLLTADRTADFLALLVDPGIDPTALSPAGWQLACREQPAWTPDEIEQSPLALALLREDVVSDIDAELALTKVRRALLFSPARRAFPRLVAALVAQAALNEGAWPFDADERAALAANADFAPAYLPPRRPVAKAIPTTDPVTRNVAEQYEEWPYPTWTRAMVPRQQTLWERVAAFDPDGPALRTPADILVAGCGTGRQVAMAAMRMPEERFTAIDISSASLAYARERCDALGLTNITFRQMDLYDVGTLDRPFDAVLCAGVLHHLSDPERGWAAVAQITKPGGVQHIMVYSRIARLRIAAVRKALSDLVTRPVDDDLLREVRRRAMALPPAVRPRGHDFHSLAGVKDLLLHRHEDLFDLPRIQRGLDSLGLELIRFDLPTQKAERRYREMRPDDVRRRDVAGWSAMERENPELFAGMYNFWCRKRI